MNTIKKHINILLLGCCSLNFISCTDLTEEIFSDITEDSYKPKIRKQSQWQSQLQ